MRKSLDTLPMRFSLLSLVFEGELHALYDALQDCNKISNNNVPAASITGLVVYPP